MYYIRVWINIVKKSLGKNLTYRFEFLSKVVRMFFLLSIQILVIRAIYQNTDSIAGWDISDYYLLLGIYNLVNYVSWGVFNVNLWRIEEKVLRGKFDFLLLYPTGSIFAAAFSEFFLDDSIAAVSGLALIVYYIINNYTTLTVMAVIGGIIAICASFVIWFSLHLAVASFNFVSPKNGFMDLLHSFSRTASVPVDIFSDVAKYVMFSIFPVAFIAVVPARILSGVYSPSFVVFSCLIALLGLILSTTIWRATIKSYTSAGG